MKCAGTSPRRSGRSSSLCPPQRGAKPWKSISCTTVGRRPAYDAVARTLRTRRVAADTAKLDGSRARRPLGGGAAAPEIEQRSDVREGRTNSCLHRLPASTRPRTSPPPHPNNSPRARPEPIDRHTKATRTAVATVSPPPRARTRSLDIDLISPTHDSRARTSNRKAARTSNPS